MSSIKNIRKIEKLFSKDVYYLYAMTLYHFLIILYAIVGYQHDSKVFYTLTLMGSQQDISHMYSSIESILYNYLVVIIILILDIIFLILVMKEFKFLMLSYKKIIAVEIILLTISIFVPSFRDIMFFLSLNSLQIYIVYRLILKNISILRVPILILIYARVIKFLLIPIFPG